MSGLARAWVADEDGQAVLEYIIMLLVAISIVGALAQGLRGIILALWQTITCDVAAACPTCPAPEEVRNKIANTCKN